MAASHHDYSPPPKPPPARAWCLCVALGASSGWPLVCVAASSTRGDASVACFSAALVVTHALQLDFGTRRPRRLTARMLAGSFCAAALAVAFLALASLESSAWAAAAAAGAAEALAALGGVSSGLLQSPLLCLCASLPGGACAHALRLGAAAATLALPIAAALTAAFGGGEGEGGEGARALYGALLPLAALLLSLYGALRRTPAVYDALRVTTRAAVAPRRTPRRGASPPPDGAAVGAPSSLAAALIDAPPPGASSSTEHRAPLPQSPLAAALMDGPRPRASTAELLPALSGAAPRRLERRALPLAACAAAVGAAAFVAWPTVAYPIVVAEHGGGGGGGGVLASAAVAPYWPAFLWLAFAAPQLAARAGLGCRLERAAGRPLSATRGAAWAAVAAAAAAAVHALARRPVAVPAAAAPWLALVAVGVAAGVDGHVSSVALLHAVRRAPARRRSAAAATVLLGEIAGKAAGAVGAWLLMTRRG